jgi:hypothetical protein
MSVTSIFTGQRSPGILIKVDRFVIIAFVFVNASGLNLIAVARSET